MHMYYSQRILRKGKCIFVHKCTTSALLFHLMMFQLWLLVWATALNGSCRVLNTGKMQLIPNVSHGVGEQWADFFFFFFFSKQVSVCLHGGLIQSDPNRSSPSPSLVTYTKCYLLSCPSLTLIITVDQQTKWNYPNYELW